MSTSFIYKRSWTRSLIHINYKWLGNGIEELHFFVQKKKKNNKKTHTQTNKTVISFVMYLFPSKYKRVAFSFFNEFWSNRYKVFDSSFHYFNALTMIISINRCQFNDCIFRYDVRPRLILHLRLGIDDTSCSIKHALISFLKMQQKLELPQYYTMGFRRQSNGLWSPSPI